MSSANQQNHSHLRSVVNFALLAGIAAGFAVACVGSGDNNAAGGSSSTGGESAATTGGSTSTSTETGGATTAGGTSTAGTGNPCATTNGTYSEQTAFNNPTGTNPTAPYNLNAYGFATGTTPSLTQTSTGPTGLDCSAGCAVMQLPYTSGLAQYAAGSQFVEYFGTAADSTQNLLNETINMDVAVTVSPAGAAVPVTVVLFGQDTSTDPAGVANIWVKDLGALTTLDASAGWHHVTYKVVDAHVPSWAPTHWLCASTLHDIGIVIQNNAAVTDANAGVVTLYVKGVTISP